MQTTTPTPVRLDFAAHAANFARSMSQLDKASVKQLDEVDFEPRLRELVRVRASQLNGCAYCVDTHTRDARAVGESEQRLYALAVWRETPFFTARERAVLAFTETVTCLSDTHVPEEEFQALAEHLGPDEIGALLALIVTINAWNAISVASRAWQPEPYELTEAS